MLGVLEVIEPSDLVRKVLMFVIHVLGLQCAAVMAGYRAINNSRGLGLMIGCFLTLTLQWAISQPQQGQPPQKYLAVQAPDEPPNHKEFWRTNTTSPKRLTITVWF